MTDVGVARNAPPCLALDIGATKVEAAIVDADGTLRSRARINDADHHDDLISAVLELARRVMAEGTVEVVGVGSEERRVGKECCLVCRSRWSPYH